MTDDQTFTVGGTEVVLTDAGRRALLDIHRINTTTAPATTTDRLVNDELIVASETGWDVTWLGQAVWEQLYGDPGGVGPIITDDPEPEPEPEPE